MASHLKISQVNLRITEKSHAWLKNFSTRTGMSMGDVAEQMVGYLDSLGSDAERVEVLKGARLAELGEALEQLGWSDHAFTLERWPWALSEYQRLEQIPGDRSPGLKRLAMYKLGFCWLDMATELRCAAITGLPALRKAHFDAALNAIRYSLALGMTYLKNRQHRVVRFNTACGWSLLAQYKVEASIVDEAIIDALRAPLRIEVPQLRAREEDRVWKKIGERWRGYAMRDGKKLHQELSEHVARWATRAMDNLKKMTASGDSDLLPKDALFLVKLSDQDPDLRFLRQDKEARKAFVKWRENEKGSPILQSFEGLQAGVSDAIRSMATLETLEGWPD